VKKTETKKIGCDIVGENFRPPSQLPKARDFQQAEERPRGSLYGNNMAIHQQGSSSFLSLPPCIKAN
jgi:hypothetical protein